MGAAPTLVAIVRHLGDALLLPKWGPHLLVLFFGATGYCDPEIYARVARDGEGHRLVAIEEDLDYPQMQLKYQVDFVTVSERVSTDVVSLALGAVSYEGVSGWPEDCFSAQYFQVFYSPQQIRYEVIVGLEGASCREILTAVLQSHLQIQFLNVRTRRGSQTDPVLLQIK